ncbi:MAG: hypothetical protein DMF62_12195 [Acidobacteria bacterium]|nr:MAG: hypothetical protein DMF62_12195 [Acidobacteriota bacterium]
MNEVQYVIDSAGNKTAVIVPIEDYEEFLEDRYFNRAAEENKDEPNRPLEDVVNELRDSGEIDV